MSEPTLNYELMFESAVFSLQNAYAEYKEAVIEQLRWTFFDSEGHFGILDGYIERKDRTIQAQKEVKRLIKVVNDLRERREP